MSLSRCGSGPCGLSVVEAWAGTGVAVSELGALGMRVSTHCRMLLALGQAVLFCGCQTLLWRDVSGGAAAKVVVDGQQPDAELVGRIRARGAGENAEVQPRQLSHSHSAVVQQPVSSEVVGPVTPIVVGQQKSTPAIARTPAPRALPSVSALAITPTVSLASFSGGEQVGATRVEPVFNGPRIAGVRVMGVSKDAFGAAVALLKFATGESLVVRLGQAISVPIDGGEHSLFVATIGARNVVLRDASTNKLWEVR